MLWFENNSVQLLIHGGDISYADGTMSIWDQYFRMVQPFASAIPFMTAAGNHENYYRFSTYYHRFQMPVAESGSKDKQYYSFNYEKVHYIIWSVEQWAGVDLRPEGAQYQWLENDLIQANSDRDVRPWIVLFGHRPMYCSTDSNDCTEKAAEWRALIEDLINDYHVDVVLGAHKHNYERTYPVYDSQPTQEDYENPLAPSYFVVGTGGKEKNDDFISPSPDWSAYQDDKYGYLLLSAADEYEMQLVYLSKSWNVQDSATITRTSIPTNWSFTH